MCVQLKVRLLINCVYKNVYKYFLIRCIHGGTTMKLYWRYKKDNGKWSWIPAATVYDDEGNLIVLLDAELET